jgi:micrococcal nuclease
MTATARAMPTQQWVFRAHPEHTVDADTLDVTLDLGLHTRRLERLRLAGVNAPETRGATREAGLAAWRFADAWLAEAAAVGGWALVVQTYRTDAFGRYIALVFRSSDGRCLNDDLISSGNAVVFMPGPVVP